MHLPQTYPMGLIVSWLGLLAAGCAPAEPDRSSRPSAAPAAVGPVTPSSAAGSAAHTAIENPTGVITPPVATPAPDAGAPLTPASCGADHYMARSKVLELVVLFDNSGTMLFPRLDATGQFVTDPTTGQALVPWDIAVSEMNTFVHDPASAGVSVALKYFGEDCTVAFYAMPDVPMGELPAQAAAVSDSLANTVPLSDTATRPALQGALMYARQRLSREGSNARVVVLLVTDGTPDAEDCADNTPQAVADAAAEGLAGTLSVPTYVLVTAPDLDLQAMNGIARAGGTNAALLADLAAPGQLLRVMNEVRSRELQALPCDYALPSEYADYNDPDLVNLNHDGKRVGRVSGAQLCDTTRGGWFYDVPAAPSRIRACPSTCQQLQRGGAVEVELGCPVVVVPGPQ